ncbi:MAG TPA: GDSL-type esterase/lipase family protein [Gaiellaceae bacterium]
MRTLVCFGDSNTWGYIPGSDGERFPRAVRWPRRLATALGDEWDVIAEGLNGRTATMDSPVADGRNGLPYLVPCLHSHMPVDVVVIYLGTNDAGDRYSLPEEDVAGAVGRLVRVVRASEAGPGRSAPAVLVVCPPAFESHELGAYFAAMCGELGCELLDLDGIAAYSDLDGIHLDAEGHAAVAAAVEERLRRMPV